jgi:hypothetical protein
MIEALASQFRARQEEKGTLHLDLGQHGRAM